MPKSLRRFDTEALGGNWHVYMAVERLLRGFWKPRALRSFTRQTSLHSAPL